MKRALPLVPLSREHHEALVLARRACEPQRADPAALRLHLLARWDAQFADHFATEEATLLPALAAAGCADAASEAAAQHARLRALIATLRAGELDALPAWGAAMREHVQWEERSLFPLAESVLELSALAAGLHRPEGEP
jgi:hemerythrin-like domain-containing protein